LERAKPAGDQIRERTGGPGEDRLAHLDLHEDQALILTG
jgi:hypothetical protein